LAKRPRELVQLAGEWRGGIPEHGAWVEEKLDGVRAAWIGGELLTREGQPIGGIDHIAYRLRSIEKSAGHAIFFDGEFIAPGGYRATLRHIGQGLRAPEQGTLHCFDAMPSGEWAQGGSDRPLYERKAMLADWLALAADPSKDWAWRPGTHGREPIGPALAIVPDQWCATQADVEDMAARIWARDGEGVMIKDESAPYRRTRTNAWRKYKRAGWSVRKVA
jgi:ATP-dependent DNA ligase